jgi:SAM-dependent methyltransferase
MADIEKVKQQYLSDKHLSYHEKQYEEPKLSTVSLCNFVSKVIAYPQVSIKALDVGCGAGANMLHLSKVLVNTNWVGLDFADKHFGMAKKYMNDGSKFTFKQGDFFKLSEMFGEKAFDVVFSIQTLSWLPKYEDALKEIMTVAKKYVFITSLFTDFQVDVYSNVFEYDDDGKVRPDSPYNYNVYSLDRFKNFCLQNGAKDIIARDFVIDRDLTSSVRTMGTYTVKKQDDGTRLQFSGPLHLPWKEVAIILE